MQSMTSTNIKGLDVSHFQGDIDWQKVKNTGIQFVYIKASQGTRIVDPMFSTYVQGCKAAGLSCGAYHFADPLSHDANDEAMHFFYAIKDSLPDFGDLAPVLDIELPTDPSSTDGEYLVEWAKTFINEFTYLSGRGVMVYTGNWWLDQFGITNLADTSTTVWISNYGTNQPKDSGGWSRWTCFQYSENGSCLGVSGNIDLDVATSLDELYGWKVADITRVTTADLNVRWGHSADYGIKTQILKGTTIHITKLNPSWAFASEYGGWVSRNYLTTP